MATAGELPDGVIGSLYKGLELRHVLNLSCSCSTTIRIRTMSAYAEGSRQREPVSLQEKEIKKPIDNKNCIRLIANWNAL